MTENSTKEVEVLFCTKNASKTGGDLVNADLQWPIWRGRRHINHVGETLPISNSGFFSNPRLVMLVVHRNVSGSPE